MSAAGNSTNFIKPLKWLVLALVFKLMLYFIFASSDTASYVKFSGMFIKSPDHAEYISPIDNYIDKGNYSLDGSNEPYAGRLPGFIFPYIIFRAAFNEGTANILLGCFILLMSVTASYALGLLLFNLTQKRMAFIAGFLLINFIPYFWHYDWTLHPSSLGVSCLILFAYYFYAYLSHSTKKHLLFAGFFICWLVMLRGFCLLYLPLVILFLVFEEKNNGKPIKQIFVSAAIFIIPFTVFESMWITRNYISLHKFVPLQTSFVPGADSKNQEYGYRSITKYSLTKVRELIFTWGGENVWYFPGADISWFGWNGGTYDSDFQFDNSIFFKEFTKDTLVALRNDIIYSYSDSLTQTQHDSIENKIAATANHLKEKFKANKASYYYLKAPMKRVKNYLIRNVTQDWPGSNFKSGNFLQKTMKLISLASYGILLMQIFFFPVIYYRNRKKISGSDRFYLMCYLLLLTSIFPFAYLIVMSHYTYFIFGFTMLIPIFVYNLKALIPNKP